MAAMLRLRSARPLWRPERHLWTFWDSLSFPDRTKRSRHERIRDGAKRGEGWIEPQVLAANVDTVFLVTNLVSDLSLRRIERYLSVGVEVYAVSAVAGSNLVALQQYLGRGQAAVFLGSSGVGKSTLINSLLGSD